MKLKLACDIYSYVSPTQWIKNRVKNDRKTN